MLLESLMVIEVCNCNFFLTTVPPTIRCCFSHFNALQVRQMPNVIALKHAGAAAAEFSAQAIPGFLQTSCSTRRFSFFLLILSNFYHPAFFLFIY